MTCCRAAARGALACALWLAVGMSVAHAAPLTLLNVSYDVSREFFKDYNRAFAAHWQEVSGATPTIQQSHGGSSRQAHAVLDGLEADVVTMNQARDIDLLAEQGHLVDADWARRLPDHSAPTTSVSIILVRRGNPKQIRDWSDLGRPGVSVIIPNPKTSGNGRYAYLAAWGAARKSALAETDVADAVARIFANVPVFDGGGRAATTTFAQRQIGDALVTFESEVPLIRGEFGDGFEVIYPRWTVLAENPVALVDRVVDKHGTRRLAQAYLEYLWSDPAQEIAASHHLRPRSAAVMARHAAQFPAVQAFTVDEVFGGWARAQKDHFDEGASVDRVLARASRR